jgi:hypothetical protein
MDPYMTVSIIGSFRKHYDKICEAKETFARMGLKVLAPNDGNIVDKSVEYVLLDTDTSSSPTVNESAYIRKLLESDLVYVCNVGGYVGLTAMLEISIIMSKGQEIYFMEQPVDPLLAAMCDGAKDNVVYSPDELCEMINISNDVAKSREWFDSYHERVQQFKL